MTWYNILSEKIIKTPTNSIQRRVMVWLLIDAVSYSLLRENILNLLATLEYVKI